MSRAADEEYRVRGQRRTRTKRSLLIGRCAAQVFDTTATPNVFDSAVRFLDGLKWLTKRHTHVLVLSTVHSTAMRESICGRRSAHVNHNRNGESNSILVRNQALISFLPLRFHSLLSSDLFPFRFVFSFDSIDRSIHQCVSHFRFRALNFCDSFYI